MRGKHFFVFLFALALAAAAAAQTKISGTHQCKLDPASPVEIGDRPGHAFVIGKAQCTWTKTFEMGGTQVKDGVSVSSDEVSGDTATSHGYHMSTMANGDKFSVSFKGTTKSKDGKPVSGGGTWSFIDGTGKLKGIKGKGTYKGTPNADGTMTYEVDGEYSLP